MEKTVQRDFKTWTDENESALNEMEPFKFFTHCTDDNFNDKTELVPKSTPGKWEAPLAEENAPGGVWFAMGLYQSKLPTISPYGVNRLLMPWDKLIKNLTDDEFNPPCLFLESIQFRNDQSKRNVRLMLVKHNDSMLRKWCDEKGLLYLDILENPFMRLKEQKMTTHKNGKGKDTWVVLFVPYAVNIEGCRFDLNAVNKWGHL